MKRYSQSGTRALWLASAIAVTVVLFPIVAHSGNPEWMNFTASANIRALADDGEYLWIGGGGLSRLNKATGEMVMRRIKISNPYSAR